MLFNTYAFGVFFTIVLVLYNSSLSWNKKKAVLVIASYLFYAAWNPPFVALIWISTVVDWFASKKIFSSRTVFHKRLYLTLTIATNLGLLGFFKYGNFLLENFTAMLETVGIAYSPPALDIVLPVGISFFTFQTLSYSLDIYRGQLKPWPKFLDFALFVTFFPQLVAGPIVRARKFLFQCETERKSTLAGLGWGCSLIALGLFQKSVVADGLLAPVVDRIYSGKGIPTFDAAWIGTLAFSGQIFCDFAGYSTCAIGIAACLGFRLPTNFRFPYAAIGFSDFWQRWHISLSSWLRDYLYIPLGGNRHGWQRTIASIMTTMLIGGLWHGASWSFVIWGGLHGLYLVIERGLRHYLGAMFASKNRALMWAMSVLTFLAVTVAWVFFRAQNFDQAFDFIGAMSGLAAIEGTIVPSRRDLIISLTTMAGICFLHWIFREHSIEDIVGLLPKWVLVAGLAAMIFSILTMSGSDRAFIYFQF